MSGYSELKKRKHVSFEQPLMMPKSVDDLPYGGKVFIARQKKPDTWPMFLFQVFYSLNFQKKCFNKIYNWLICNLGWLGFVCHFRNGLLLLLF